MTKHKNEKKYRKIIFEKIEKKQIIATFWKINYKIQIYSYIYLNKILKFKSFTKIYEWT